MRLHGRRRADNADESSPGERVNSNDSYPEQASEPDWRQQELAEWRDVARALATDKLQQLLAFHRSAARNGDEDALPDDVLGVFANELARRGQLLA